jgi:hypothetical protein
MVVPEWHLICETPYSTWSSISEGGKRVWPNGGGVKVVDCNLGAIQDGTENKQARHPKMSVLNYTSVRRKYCLHGRYQRFGGTCCLHLLMLISIIGVSG